MTKQQEVEKAFADWIPEHTPRWINRGHIDGEDAVVWWWCVEQEVPMWNDMSQRALAQSIKDGHGAVTYKYVIETITDTIGDEETLKDYIDSITTFYGR